jgi:RNA polymerase sigma-70 factor (ECF subfamily)
MPIDNMLPTPGPSIAELKDDLLKAIPKLRAYARNLCRSTERADDLVQEALVKALAHINTFVPGSNLTAWLYTILRNEFYSAFRKRRREVEDNGGRHAALLQVRPVQEGHMHFLDVRNALTRLTTEHREALMLVVSGLSYQEAAVMCGCASGTMKSRISRARDKLAEMFDDRRTTVGDADYGLVPDRSRRMDIGTGAMRAGSAATI